MSWCSADVPWILPQAPVVVLQATAGAFMSLNRWLFPGNASERVAAAIEAELRRLDLAFSRLCDVFHNSL